MSKNNKNVPNKSEDKNTDTLNSQAVNNTDSQTVSNTSANNTDSQTVSNTSANNTDSQTVSNASASNTDSQAVSNTSVNNTDTKTSDNVRIKAKSLTGKNYFRAGLKFSATDSTYEVSKEVLSVLKADNWLQVTEL